MNELKEAKKYVYNLPQKTELQRKIKGKLDSLIRIQEGNHEGLFEGIKALKMLWEDGIDPIVVLKEIKKHGFYGADYGERN